LRLIDDCVGELGCATQADERSGEAVVQRLPAAALAALAAWSMAGADVARAAEFYTPPPPPSGQQATQQKSQSLDFPTSAAPAVKSGEFQLPEGNQWRYSEFINAVQAGKVERVRFSKDGGQLQARLLAGSPCEVTSVSLGTCFLLNDVLLNMQTGSRLPGCADCTAVPLQLTAVDGRRALVVLPNDPELVDILARNGVDISVSEGDQQGNYVALLGNLLFPLVAFGGLFFLFRRAGGSGGAGPMGGPMGGPMDFARNKSKFQEVPETGVTFADVAVRVPAWVRSIWPAWSWVQCWSSL